MTDALFSDAAARQSALAVELQASLNALALELPAPVFEHHRGLVVAYLRAVEETIKAIRRA